jgi:ABC-2 type transport system permease protein
MNASITIWHKHMRKLMGNPEESVGMLIQPALWVVLFGIGMSGLFDQSTGVQSSYLAFMVPGIIALTALSGAIAGGATWLNERLLGIVKEYMVAPIPRLSILVGNILSMVAKGTLQSLVILVVAVLMGVSVAAGVGAWLAGLVLIIGFSAGFAGIALAAGSKADNSGEYHMMIMFFNLPLLFLSNALYPLDSLPKWMEIGARLNPTTYVVAGLRQTILPDTLAATGGEAISLPLCFAVVAGFVLLGIWMAYGAFKGTIK